MEARQRLENWGVLLQEPEHGEPEAGTLLEKLLLAGLAARLLWAQWWPLKIQPPRTCTCALVWKRGLCDGIKLRTSE